MPPGNTESQFFFGKALHALLCYRGPDWTQPCDTCTFPSRGASCRVPCDMCGILAILCADAAEVRLAAQPAGAPAPATGSSVPDADFVRMLGARQQHRGPDAQEVHTGSGWALAHQRLSIMDPQEVGAGAPASVLRGRQLRRAHSRLAHARARAAATPRPAAALFSRSHPAALRMPVLPRPRPPPRPCLAVGEPALPFRERPAAGGHPPRPQWRGARTRASAPQARRRQYASERARACCERERERERERASEREREK